jgi:hypothetical protein
MRFSKAALQSLAVLAALRGTKAFARSVPFGGVSANTNPWIRSIATTSALLAASSVGSKKDQSFPTWSFDKPCGSMEWNDLVTATLSASTNTTSYQASDLVLIGVYPPPKKATTTDDEKTKGVDEEDEEEEEEGEEATIDKKTPEIQLVGLAKQLDEQMGGALTELLVENHKSFKHGASAGSTTPTLRFVNGNGKVSTTEYEIIFVVLRKSS